MIILNSILTLTFVYFAYLNLNDPDAWLWVSIYLFAAICCGAAVFGRYYPFTYLILISFYLIYAVYLFFAKDGTLDWIRKYHMENIAASMQATKPYIEQTREFFGLLIVSTALLINYFVYR